MINPINFGARFAYLKALEEHWLTVLTNLKENTFEVYRRCWKAQPNTTALQNLDLLNAAVRRGDGEEFEAVAEALQQWANRYRFLDPWLQDAGIQTMYGWFLGENAGKWRYFPEELEIPRLQLPNFGYWIPSYSSWTEFKRIIESMVRLKLLEYRATVSTLWGQQKPKLPEHAAWTVRWQLGKSPAGIRNWHRHMTGETISVTSVQLAVHAFAKSAGITLRTSKAGPRTKKI
jgi:hypothetical protein